MSIKILHPSRYDGNLDKGGSTKPWKVFLMDNNNEKPYVVKLFTPRQIQQQHAVAKEVYGNVLATSFGLPVPEFALVDFDDFFVKNLLDESAQTVLESKDTGLKFASVLLENMTIVSSYTDSKHLLEYDIAKVFAFDCLIQNLDRGGLRNKPNLLIDDDEFLLIDHEQCFPFADNEDWTSLEKIKSKIEDKELTYNFRKHLFYPLLSSMNSKKKLHLFDEFEELLRNLNINNISLIINKLESLNVSTGQKDIIIDYLSCLKNNSNKFREALIRSIA